MKIHPLSLMAVAFSLLPLPLAMGDMNGSYLVRGLQNCDKDGDGFLKNSGNCGGNDCDDNDPTVNPGAAEICGDGIDNNCNGQIDEGCDGGGGGSGTCGAQTPNAGATCTSDVDCGGTCLGGTSEGNTCSIDDNCPPNNGNPSNRGRCNEVAGSCTFAPTTAPPTASPTNSPPTSSPTPRPTLTPTFPQPTMSPNAAGTCPNGPVTYFPGDLTVTLNSAVSPLSTTGSLLASTGLNGRVLTRSGSRVPFPLSGGQSSVNMHGLADGAATVPDDSNPNIYYLVSNSETSSGGVGILTFDATTTPHQVIGYRRTQQNSNTGSRNCGGGRTPWGTWLTSQESGSGLVYEIDPAAPPGSDFCLSPIVPSAGGNYESNAFWAASDGKYHFYTTNDSGSNYLLTRFVPNVNRATMDGEPNKLSKLCGRSGTLTYLNLSCNSGCSGNNPSGTYSWTTSRSTGATNFAYPSAEGIDVKDNQMYFVTKGQRRLYIVDLDSNTWTSGPTIQSNSGTEFSPDQVARITGSNSPNDILYFCEDGSGNQDIHALGLDSTGDKKFYTIIRGYSSTETTGLTFSPDNKYMYFAHQGNSEIWQIWREDGCTFGDGNYLDVNYHTFNEGLRALRGAGETEMTQDESGTAEILA